LIFNGMAYASEARGDTAGALDYYEKITAGGTDVLTADALFNMARIYDSQGDSARSADLYQRLLTGYPDAMYAELAREWLAVKKKG